MVGYNKKRTRSFGYDYRGDDDSRKKDVNLIAFLDPNNAYFKPGNETNEPDGVFIDVQVDARAVDKNDPTGTLHLILERDMEDKDKRTNNRAYYTWSQVNQMSEASKDNVWEFPTKSGRVLRAIAFKGDLMNITTNKKYDGYSEKVSQTIVNTKSLSPSDFKLDGSEINRQNEYNSHFAKQRAEEFKQKKEVNRETEVKVENPTLNMFAKEAQNIKQGGGFVKDITPDGNVQMSFDDLQNTPKEDSMQKTIDNVDQMYDSIEGIAEGVETEIEADFEDLMPR